MNSSDFTMVENRIIDWYESLNDSNTVGTVNMRTRIPPFLQYTDNNGYSYKGEGGNIITFNSEQQSVIRELINEEIERMNSIRNSDINTQLTQPSNYLNGRFSMEAMGGRKRKSKKRKSKKRKSKY